MAKIKCPNPDHDDQNPSAEVYEDGIYCFSCGYYERGEYEAEEKPKENIKEKIKTIKTLPQMYIRKLQFYTDRNGYYIVWPDESYYKLRTFSGSLRYIAPVGHKPPLLICTEGKKTLVIIEGELNALSLSHSLAPASKDSLSIVSPGPATQFLRYLEQYLTIADKNAIVVIVVDHDPTGVAAGISLKRELIKKGRRVQLITCKKDLNQMLQDGGEEEIRCFWEKEVAM